MREISGLVFEPDRDSSSSGAPTMSQSTSASVSLNTWRNWTGPGSLSISGDFCFHAEMTSTTPRLVRIRTGDLDGFFGLFVDNLLQLLLIFTLCPLLCGISAAEVV